MVSEGWRDPTKYNGFGSKYCRAGFAAKCLTQGWIWIVKDGEEESWRGTGKLGSGRISYVATQLGRLGKYNRSTLASTGSRSLQGACAREASPILLLVTRHISLFVLVYILIVQKFSYPKVFLKIDGWGFSSCYMMEDLASALMVSSNTRNQYPTFLLISVGFTVKYSLNLNLVDPLWKSPNHDLCY